MQKGFPTLNLALALVLAAAVWPADARADDPYPTDLCVAAKLEAAGEYCSVAVGAKANPGFANRLEEARAELMQAWSDAEAASADEGVACTQTTVSAEQMLALVDAGADQIAAGVPGGGACRQRRLQSAGRACRDLLAAWSDHLLERTSDREREELAHRQQQTLTVLEHTWNLGCPAAPSLADVIAGLAESARLAAVVSPHVSTNWTMITPPAQVPYKGQVLDPVCSTGAPWVYFVRRGTVNKLLVYYQGGGACWDYFTCASGTHKRTAGPGDNPANTNAGFANMNNPDNPFQGWHSVMIPYCTGDIHWGDAVVQHQLGVLSTTVRHKGRVNAAVAEKWAREHFVDPDEVFVTGSSAGSYGAILNGLYLLEDVYPSATFSILGDGGNGVITDEFQTVHLPKWGVENTMPDWIPALDVPVGDLSAVNIWSEGALFYPHSRVANYTTAFDGGSGGQVGFYNIMLSSGNVALWAQWWRPSCEWNERMREMSYEAAATAPNYRYFIDPGSRHTMWGTNRVYAPLAADMPSVASWVQAMVSGSPEEWENVECSDCGLLLTGDPRPNPLQSPYFAGPAPGPRVVCD